MKFKITEIDTLKLKVEYEDGSWAYIPTDADGDKGYYAQQIANFCHTPQEPVPIGDIPYTVGHEGEVGDDIPEVEAPEPRLFTAEEIRQDCYPSDGMQLDALYHQRNGDSSQQTKVDAHIKLVKDSIAMDSTEYTAEQATAILKDLKTNPAFIQETEDEAPADET